MCLNMQYQPNLTVEVFTPWKYQSGAVSELSTVFHVPRIKWEISRFKFYRVYTIFFPRLLSVFSTEKQVIISKRKLPEILSKIFLKE